MSFTSRPVLAVFLLAIFILAATLGGPGNGLEQSVMAGAAELRSSLPAVARMASAVTLLGGYPFTLAAALLASLWLIWRRQWALAFLLMVTVLGERWLVDALKDWIGRTRPPLEVLPDSLAFPSGHSANSMTTYLAVAMMAFPPRIRRTAIILALGLALLVGLTRLVLGVHWPTDVIGGWTLGLFVVGLAVTVGERSAILPVEAKHDVVGGHLPPVTEDKPA